MSDKPGWGLGDEEQQEDAQGGEDAADTSQHTPADCLKQGLVIHNSEMRDSHEYTQNQVLGEQIFSCEAQLNTCTYVLSVRLSVCGQT